MFPYVFPLVTNYWSENTAMINFIGTKAGGMDKLKGKKIVILYHGSAYGKETIPILDLLAKKYGFTVTHIEVAASGQRAAVAVAADPAGQARLGDPARLGRHEPGRAEDGREDRLPARPHHRRLVERRGRGRDARPATPPRATSRPPSPVAGRTSRCCKDVKKYVYAGGHKGNLEDHAASARSTTTSASSTAS